MLALDFHLAFEWYVFFLVNICSPLRESNIALPCPCSSNRITLFFEIPIACILGGITTRTRWAYLPAVFLPRSMWDETRIWSCLAGRTWVLGCLWPACLHVGRTCHRSGAPGIWGFQLHESNNFYTSSKWVSVTHLPRSLTTLSIAFLTFFLYLLFCSEAF